MAATAAPPPSVASPWAFLGGNGSLPKRVAASPPFHSSFLRSGRNPSSSSSLSKPPLWSLGWACVVLHTHKHTQIVCVSGFLCACVVTHSFSLFFRESFGEKNTQLWLNVEPGLGLVCSVHTHKSVFLLCVDTLLEFLVGFFFFAVLFFGESFLEEKNNNSCLLCVLFLWVVVLMVVASTPHICNFYFLDTPMWTLNVDALNGLCNRARQ